MTSLLVTGYKSFELGIFKDKDPKVTIIKKAIKRDLKRFLDDGVDCRVSDGVFRGIRAVHVPVGICLCRGGTWTV